MTDRGERERETIGRAPKIQVVKTPREIIINFNGLPHVTLKRSVVFGFQAWINEKQRDETMYSLEFYGHGGDNMLLHYDSFEKWSGILKQLSGIGLFDESEIP